MTGILGRCARALGLGAVGVVAMASTGAPAAAQTATCPGAFVDGACYVSGADVTAPSPYWPINSETSYYYGPYAFAPGYGPYLRLGGEGGWNPNLGSTYNAYPPGDYWSDYGVPSLAIRILPSPLQVRTYRGFPYAAFPCCYPTIVPIR